MVEERENITARILSNEAIEKNKGRRLVEITLSPDPKKAPIYRHEFDRLMKEGYQFIKKKADSDKEATSQKPHILNVE